MPLLRQLEATAHAFPDRVALRCSTGQCDYRTLLRRADGLAAALRAQGLRRGDRVGVQIARSMESVTAILGILRAGCAYVPIDPEYPQERQEFIAEDAELRAVVVHARASVLSASHRIVDLAMLGAAEPGPAISPEPGALLNILYTSGSTGRPKGVMGSHGAMLNRLSWGWAALPFQPGEGVAHRSSLNFVDAGPEMFSGLLQGTPTTVILPEEHANLAWLVRALQAGGVTRITLVPSLLDALLRSSLDVGSRLSGIRTWISSGEVLNTLLLRQFRATFPEATLINLYGTTEVTGDATAAVFRPGEALPDPPPIGRAIAGAELWILDARGEPVPAGEEGELYVGGPVLALGYHRRPQEEGMRFVGHPQHPALRLFHTGDRVRQRLDGALEYRGRTDTVVKRRGIRIDLEEIEHALLLRCPDVAAMAVLLVDQQVVALVSAISGAEGAVLPAQVQGAAQALPEAMRPARVVVLEQLPLLPNGKRDRQALAGLARATTRDLLPEQRPRGPLEQRLAALWRAVLGRPDVGRGDRFMELGGDSLLLAELLSKIEAEFGSSALAGIQEVTLAELAQRLEGGGVPEQGRDAGGAVSVGRVHLSPLREAAAERGVRRMVAEASHDAALLSTVELPSRMDEAAAALWCRAQDGVVLWVNGEPVGVATLHPSPYIGAGVEALPAAVEIEEWLHPDFRGAGLLGRAQVWAALVAWMAQRFDAEVSAVWEDHHAMLAMLKARGYRRLGRSYWTHPSGQGPDGWCEVWTYDLRPHRLSGVSTDGVSS